MSIDKLRNIFTEINNMENVSIQLLKIVNSKRTGTSYFARKIILTPQDALNEFVSELSYNYVKEDGGILHSYEDVVDYDGSSVGNLVYKLRIDNIMLIEQYDMLIRAIAAPDTECNPINDCFQAYLISGDICIDGVTQNVKLFSVQNPLVTLKHKFAMEAGAFKMVDSKVLSLKSTIDVVIYNEYIYMLTLSGERLFNMERTYKNVCYNKIEEIRNYDIICDFDIFQTEAIKGHNPRRFAAYNEQHLIELGNVNNRRKVAEKFLINFDGDKFDVREKTDVEKLIKILCNKGMLDPFDEKPMEVAGSRKWS